MNELSKNKKLYYRLLAIVLIASSSLLSSCFGPKNLVTKQRGVPQYDFLGDALDGWALVRQDSLWGYVTADGKQVIKPTFTWATDFADGMALAEDEKGYRYINAQGKLLRQVKAFHAYSFAQGLAPIQIKDKWGYIDRKGKVVIKPQFDWALPFHENRAEVSVGLRRGYINKNGQLIIPAIYEQSSAFKNGLAIVRKDFRYGLIDTLGNFVLPNHFDEIKPWETDFYRLGVFDPTIGRVNKFGLTDANGKLLLDTQYSAIDLQAQHYIRVEKGRLYGLYDRKGNEVIPREYTHLDAISESNFLYAKKDGLWTFLNMQGHPPLPFDDQISISASEGRIWIARDSFSILMDDQFREIKRFNTYSRVYPFSNGYAAVRMEDTSVYEGNLYGYIDREGNEVVAPQFDGGVGYVNAYGISVVGKKSYGIIRDHLFDIKTGLLVNEEKYTNLKGFGPLFYTGFGDFLSQKTGFEIQDFPYLSIQPLSDRPDLAVVRQERKAGLIDTALTELLPVEFEDIKNIYHGRMQVKKDGKWGFADEKFRIRIPIRYEGAYYFRLPILTEVTQHKKKGVIDRYGREIIPMQYTSISFDPTCDRIYAKKSNGINIYNKAGRLLHTTDFEYLGFYGRKPYVAFRQNGKTGFMDYDFNILLKPTYDRVGSFYNELAFVVLNGKGGYINERLELVLPVEFEQFDNFAIGLAKVTKYGREYYINTQGQEVIPTKDELDKRDAEIERRKSGWIDFSS